jgi:hypothetical protein
VLEVIVADHCVSSLREIEEISDALRREDEAKKPDKYSHISPLLFRGHARTSWSLETTLERAGKPNLPLDSYLRYMARVKPAVEAMIDRQFPFRWENPEEQGSRFMLSRVKFREGQYEFMVYLRHHGFPTPLLDWSRSLYVALFFAVSDAVETEASALYIYTEWLGHGKGGPVGAPEISSMGQYVTAHKRHWIQQSEYTACVAKNGEDWYFHPHADAVGCASDTSDRLIKIEIAAEARLPILRQLDSMNINAFSLYGTEEALMRTLAFRELVDDDL